MKKRILLPEARSTATKSAPFFWLTLAALLYSASASLASMWIGRSFEELATLADSVVIGRVTAIEDRWDRARGLPFMTVTLSETTFLKGEGEDVSLEFLGGTLPDGRVLPLEDGLSFEVGEKVLVFVKGNGQDIVPLVGIGQGLFRIRAGPTGRDLVYGYDMTPVEAITKDGELQSPQSQPVGREAMALNDFVLKIKEVLNSLAPARSGAHP